MATILKEGRAHKHMAWFTTCEVCESELKILEGDPLATNPVIYNCDLSQYSIRYICPVCRSKGRAKTIDHFGDGNGLYKEIVLTKEDREDMENWESDEYKKFNDEELEWINCRLR